MRLAGRDVATLAPLELAARRAVLRRRSSLTAAFTALEVVRLGQPRGDDAVARRCLAIVELDGLAGRSYPSLSGGEQQRVQLARVLAQIEACPAGALLLDEPVAALDLRQERMVERVVRHSASRGHAVVLVAHDLGFVARCADRVVVMRAGAALADGPPSAALTSAVLSRAFDMPIEVDLAALRRCVTRSPGAACPP